MMRFLPLGIDLRGRDCVVVGGGHVATRKVQTLLEAGAQVTVISPRISPELDRLHDEGSLCWLRRPYCEGLLAGAALVVAATADDAVNLQVLEEAAARGALVCDASSAARSRVIFGALHQSEHLTVAVFTDGRDPARARRMRDRLARQLPQPERSESGPAERLIVIAHGSRDARWRASLEDVIATVQEKVGQGDVALAYMDRAPPTLQDAVDAAVRAGIRRLRVLPLFLAPQGHVERDIRPLVEQARSLHPDVIIEFMPPVGQLPEFQELLCAIARVAVRPSGPQTGIGVAAADWNDGR